MTHEPQPRRRAQAEAEAEEVRSRARDEAAAAARTREEAAAKAEAEAEAADKARAQAEAQSAKAREEAEAAARAEAESIALAKAEADAAAARAREQAEASARADAEAAAAERARAEAEVTAAKAGAEADAKARADAEASAALAAATASAGEVTAGSAQPTGKPAALAAANDSRPDDLKLIKGIGPKNEAICNELGVFHFSQIADWSPENADWVGRHMKFPGRIDREKWIPQAKLLAAGIDTSHSAGVKSGAIVVDETADAPLSDDEAKAFADNLPQEMAAVEGEDKHDGRRPLGLADAKGGTPDDLKRIKGIGKQNEARLHALGVWHFDQIAAWSDENVKWVGSYLAFPGRIKREDWINQSKQLAAGAETEFSQRVAAGKVASSKDDGSLGQSNIAKLGEK